MTRAALALIAAVCIWTLSANDAAAQTTQLSAGLTTDAESVSVGDVFTLTLTVSHPRDYHVVFPDLPAQWGEFEVRSRTPLPATIDDDSGVATSALEIRAALFAPGAHSTPPLNVTAIKPDGVAVSHSARPLEIEVVPTLGAGDDALKDIRPQATIDPIIDSPLIDAATERRGLTLAAAGAVALIALALIANHYWRRKTMPQAIAMESLSPEEAALAELDRIGALDLPRGTAAATRYAMIADCLREYLRGQFGISALDMTTTEAVAELGRKPVGAPEVNELGDILREADMVKFARFMPADEDALRLLRAAKSAVRALTAAQSRNRGRGGYATGRYTN